MVLILRWKKYNKEQQPCVALPNANDGACQERTRKKPMAMMMIVESAKKKERLSKTRDSAIDDARLKVEKIKKESRQAERC
jgi:hypothetical protein